MGKSHLLRFILKREADAGAFQRILDFGSIDETELCAHFSRAVRDLRSICAKAPSLIVGIDNLIVGDENAVARISRMMRKLTVFDCTFVLALRPESYVLIDELKDDAIIWDMVDHLNPSISRDSIDWKLTHGVPDLIKGLEKDIAHDKDALESTSCLAQSLSQHWQQLLRPTLTNEERELRFAIFLLGSGTTGDLRRIVHRFNSDEFVLLGELCPECGINQANGTFQAAGLTELFVFSSVCAAFSKYGHEFSSVIERAIRVLCQCASFARAAIICEMAESLPSIHELVVEYGPEFVVAGKPLLVRDACDELKLRVGDSCSSGVLGSLGRSGSVGDSRDSRSSDSLVLARRCVAEITARRRELLQIRTALSLSSEKDQISSQSGRITQLLGSFRDALASPGINDTPPSVYKKDLPAVLAIHNAAQAKLFSGAFVETFNNLMDAPCRRNPQTLAEALVSRDYAIAAHLIGESLTFEDVCDLKKANAIIDATGVARLRAYQDALDSAVSVLLGQSDTFARAEQAIAKSEEFGDTLLEIVFMTAAAVADIRGGAFARAHVRARKAEELAREKEAHYLASAAHLVLLVSTLRLGSDIQEYEVQKCSGGLRDIARIMEHASCGELDVAVRLEAVPRFNCDRNLVWAINVVASDTGDSKGAVRSLIPEAWLDLLVHIACSKQQIDEQESHEVDMLQRAEFPSERDTKPIHINMLGRFECEVKNRTYPAERLARRRVRSLLGALALAGRHKLSRRDLIVSVWGNDDYVLGTKKLYEATSECRRLLGLNRDELDALIVSKAEGAVSLDMNLVSCDIDEFEKTAREALTFEGQDREMIRRGVKACSLYHGGLDCDFEDLSGLLVAREGELRSLFADVSSATAGAAIREGRPRLAVRLARDAYLQDPGREDIIVCLIEALAMSERLGEIIAIYADYRRSIARRGMGRPAKCVVEAMENALTKVEATSAGTGMVEATDVAAVELTSADTREALI